MNALNPVKTVLAQIIEPMELHGTAEGAAARRIAGELLERSGSPPPPDLDYPHGSRAGCASAPPLRWRSRADRRCYWPTSRRRRST